MTTPVVISFGAFELHEARFELRSHGRRLAVPPRVLDVLLHLARHRDRVVTKDELLDVVWSGVSVSEASLSQAISQARKLVGDAPEAQSTIRTVRGRGFQFVAAVRDDGGVGA